MRNLLPKIWGACILLVLVTIIGLVNYKSGTILTGWDNLHPEFNPTINIQRSIFAVWQEYQGLGLLGGMGHASDLIRQLFLALIGFVMPMNDIRYFWTILTLAIGSIGTYVFIKTLLLSYSKNLKETYGFIGGAFYLLNLATIQTYFVPFEAFINHYAFLPWLMWAFLTFVKNGGKKKLAILFAVFVVATPAAYIPTLFVAFTICLTLMIVSLTLTSKNKLLTLKNAAIGYAILIVSNSFWLLPFLYFTVTSVSVNLNAKMNQIATHTIFSQNREFGNILDVSALKGFWFNNVDPDMSGEFKYMLMPWRDYADNTLVIAAGIIIFSIILVGLLNALLKRRPFHIAVAVLFIFSFTMLTTDTPPFSWFVSLFRELPLFGQAFRFPFTKFSVLAAFSYSLLFVLGLELLNELKGKIFEKLSLPVILTVSLLLIGTISFPVFQGKLFYEKEQLKLPQEYLLTFDYFRKVDQNARIANLPQHTFWGWNFYKWGYGGSGFLWYGIKQPILDRAFDVWSAPLENYYYELSYALYSKDSNLIEQVLNKYQISYILLDKNIIAPSSPKSLFYGDTQTLLSQIQMVSKDADFGNISIYKVKLKNNIQNYLFTSNSLQDANGYDWGNIDNNYKAVGDYSTSSNPSLVRPFSSLFSNKTYQSNINIADDQKSIVFSTPLPKIQSQKLRLPSNQNGILPVKITSTPSSTGKTIIAQFVFPKISIGNVILAGSETLDYPLFEVPNTDITYTLNVNGIQNININPKSEINFDSFLLLENDNTLLLNAKNGNPKVLDITSSFLRSLKGLKEKEVLLENIKAGTLISVTIPRHNDSYNSYSFSGRDFKNITDCNIFRDGSNSNSLNGQALNLSSNNDSLCSFVTAPTLSHQHGYYINVVSENKEGNSIHFWALNDREDYVPIEVDLAKNKSSHTFVIPPMDRYGLSYSLHADNTSIGNSPSINILKKVYIQAIPYNFIAGITIGTPKTSTGKSLKFESEHPNESLYIFKPEESVSKNTKLILSQSFDSGWKAYEVKFGKSRILNGLRTAFPFVLGKEIKTHSKINNWANGWKIGGDKDIVIVYLPQYLQYLGFAGIVLFVIAMIPFRLLKSLLFKR